VIYLRGNTDLYISGWTR